MCLQLHTLVQRGSRARAYAGSSTLSRSVKCGEHLCAALRPTLPHVPCPGSSCANGRRAAGVRMNLHARLSTRALAVATCPLSSCKTQHSRACALLGRVAGQGEGCAGQVPVASRIVSAACALVVQRLRAATLRCAWNCIRPPVRSAHTANTCFESAGHSVSNLQELSIPEVDLSLTRTNRGHSSSSCGCLACQVPLLRHE